MTSAAPIAERFDPREIEQLSRMVLLAAGADEVTADAATRAMMHGSRLGIDSHGIRLLPHYVTAITGGRVKGRPNLRFVSESGAVATLDADHAHGALAAYVAMARAAVLAQEMGIGAVAIQNTSHFGPAGAYSLAAAEEGCVGLTSCNSDSFVRLHDGAERFHGTNPLAIAVPLSGKRPWLFDMATSAISYNRVQLQKSLKKPLPDGTASNAGGHDTQDAEEVDMLAPLGGAFGFKGAGLAGLAEILSAVLTGMRLSFDIPPMAGPDFSTPRGMGAFVLAIRPSAFVPQAVFESGMRRYVERLRASRPVAGGKVLAPGDREWAEAERRARDGIPIDPTTAEALVVLSHRYGIRPPPPMDPSWNKQASP